MSRLIVKNLPSFATPDKLRDHFKQKGCPEGIITDIKVASKPDGTSRRFGFVGYKTEQEALAAMKWFDKTFLGGSRLNVNVVEGAKDAPPPRPNKRPRLDPSLLEPSTSSLRQPQEKPSKTDKQLDEFMDVMQPKSRKGPAWKNDIDVPPGRRTGPNAIVVAAPSAADDQIPEAVSDAEWLRRRMTSAVDNEVKAFEQSEDEDEIEARQEVKEEEADPTKRTVLQTSRLFVRNLAFSCTEEELHELFSSVGPLSRVHVPLDTATGQSKGLAYVTFAKPADAVTAYETFDKKSFQGRLLHILAAVDPQGKESVIDADGKKRAVKDEKVAKQKAVAGKDFNWSMLFMNSDAVASSIADRMNIPKSTILNPESSDGADGTNPAVKLALAETHIINETKTYLESHGVVVDSFAAKVPRSDTIILVKNIPYSTSETQIREMFEAHGSLIRVLVPPAGTIAVVEFDRSDEASKAFRGLAYRRLGNSVIYLEKGPLGLFSGAPVLSSHKNADSSSSHAIRIAEQDAAIAEEPSISSGTTLFVKNLAFSTTSERLIQMFGTLPSFAFARVQTKPDPKRPGEKLSMGYGFIGFKDSDGAAKALGSLQGHVLDGHALHVKFAGRGTETDVSDSAKAASKSRTTKMIVKNVPFEASKKDIRDLFGSHGHLKSVRLPRKFQGRTRGFAFLEFVSRQDAENAYTMLRHTHLLGRHLVLEWAEEEDQDLDALRKKAGVGFGDGKEMPGRKRKLDMGGPTTEPTEDMEE